MIISDSVFRAARDVNDGPLKAYGMVCRLDGSGLSSVTAEARADSTKTVDSALAFLRAVLQRMERFRDTMRTDLGVTSAGNG